MGKATGAAGAAPRGRLTAHPRRASSVAITNVVARQGALASNLKRIASRPAASPSSATSSSVCFFRFTWLRMVLVCWYSWVGAGECAGGGGP